MDVDDPPSCDLGAERPQWLRLVQNNGLSLSDAPMALRADEEIVRMAVSQDG